MGSPIANLVVEGLIGGSSNSSPTSPTSPPSSTLSAPAVTASAVSSTVAELSWNAVSGAQGYKVYQVTSTGQDNLLGTVASGTSVQVSKLAAGSTDSFMVAAYNSTSTADSSVVTVTLPSQAVPASVSQANSPWVYVVTPSASPATYSLFAQYAEQGFGNFASFANSNTSIGSASGHQAGQERW